MVQFDRKVNKSSDFMESFLTRNQTTRSLFWSVRPIFFGLAMLLERTYPSLLHTLKSKPKQQEQRERGSLPSSHRETGSPPSLAK